MISFMDVLSCAGSPPGLGVRSPTRSDDRPVVAHFFGLSVKSSAEAARRVLSQPPPTRIVQVGDIPTPKPPDLGLAYRAGAQGARVSVKTPTVGCADACS